MSVMHASPWRPNIPREAIKQNSKLTWLSYLQRIWQTFCNIYLMVKPCIANFHFLNLNIHARSYMQVPGTMGWLGQSPRWRGSGGFLKGSPCKVLKRSPCKVETSLEPRVGDFEYQFLAKKALNILNLTLPKSLDTV